MKTAAAFVVGVIIGGLGVYFGLRAYQTRGFYDPPYCEARVSIAANPDTGTFEVTPKNVCLYVGHHLKWDVKTPQGDTVEIVFTDADKPFAYDVTNGDNTPEGTYKVTRPKLIDSNAALDKVGRFNYKVLWTHGSDPAKEIDPVVCIRKG